MTPVLTQSGMPAIVFLVLAGCFFLVMAVSLMMGPMLVVLADEFHTSVAVTGQLASATFIGWAVVALLVGPIFDSYWWHPIALIGLGLMVSGLLGSVVSVNYEMLFALRLIKGFGSGMLPQTVMEP